MIERRSVDIATKNTRDRRKLEKTLKNLVIILLMFRQRIFLFRRISQRWFLVLVLWRTLNIFFLKIIFELEIIYQFLYELNNRLNRNLSKKTSRQARLDINDSTLRFTRNFKHKFKSELKNNRCQIAFFAWLNFQFIIIIIFFFLYFLND
jgi:hypothetical protein